jgi:hypothetical protein
MRFGRAVRLDPTRAGAGSGALAIHRGRRRWATLASFAAALGARLRGLARDLLDDEAVRGLLRLVHDHDVIAWREAAARQRRAKDGRLHALAVHEELDAHEAGRSLSIALPTRTGLAVEDAADDLLALEVQVLATNGLASLEMTHQRHHAEADEDHEPAPHPVPSDEERGAGEAHHEQGERPVVALAIEGRQPDGASDLGCEGTLLQRGRRRRLYSRARHAATVHR